MSRIRRINHKQVLLSESPDNDRDLDTNVPEPQISAQQHSQIITFTFTTFFALFHSGSLSLFDHVSSSLCYIIRASASHSEIKACACVPSHSKAPYSVEGQTCLCRQGLKRRKCLQRLQMWPHKATSVALHFIISHPFYRFLHES